MFCSANVRLFRTDTSVLQEIDDRYGDADGLVRQLETCILSLREGRADSAAASPTARTADALSERGSGANSPGERKSAATDAVSSDNSSGGTRVQELEAALRLAERYGALGAGMGDAAPATLALLLSRLQLLLKQVLQGRLRCWRGEGEREGERGADEQHDDAAAEEEEEEEERLTALISRCIANCGGGVARRAADTTLSVRPLPAALPGGGSGGGGVSVTFGFADWADAETAARLWAGAVGLSLYVLEQLPEMLLRARLSPPTPGERVRVIELGCGPGLVSLTLARRYLCLLQEEEEGRSPRVSLPPVELHVTDIAPAAIQEVRRSFARRNGGDMARLLQPPPATASGGSSSSNGSSHASGGPPVGDGSGGDDAGDCSDGGCDGSETVTDAPPPPRLRVLPYTLDFGSIPPELCGRFDLVLGSDIVYDFTIAALVAPALAQLLRPPEGGGSAGAGGGGGRALLCCEAHRDGMSTFITDTRAHLSETLQVEWCAPDVQERLEHLQMILQLSSSSCALMSIRRIK